MTFLEECNDQLRRLYLQQKQAHKSTGWEDATLADVEHIQIENLELVAIVMAIEARLDAHTREHVQGEYLRQMEGF